MRLLRNLFPHRVTAFRAVVTEKVTAKNRDNSAQLEASVCFVTL